MRGLLWGLVLWLAAEAVVMPLVGAGFFGGRLPQPWAASLWSLTAHVVYGLLLGSIATPETTRRIKEEDEARGGREAA